MDFLFIKKKSPKRPHLRMNLLVELKSVRTSHRQESSPHSSMRELQRTPDFYGFTQNLNGTPEIDHDGLDPKHALRA